ncbi:nucleoside deaminase [Kytococcus sedentarius]|uniref:nucleoside deaminase n=1 Tax=Kytococcus sedentarius TaxID=1276 RepID=UPI0035BC46B7
MTSVTNPDRATQEAWIGHALAAGEQALALGDVPVGAVVIGPDGDVIGRGWNLREATGDPLAHAEVVAMREAAAARGGWRLEDCALAVTLEPCLMCAGALGQARIPLVVFGAWDAKAGACGSVWDVLRDSLALHRAEVRGGVREEDCRRTLGDFFVTRRV